MTYAYTRLDALRSTTRNASYALYFIYALRIITFCLMVFLIFKPQLVYQRRPTTMQGVDIVLALDVSESMLCFDDIQDQRSRFEVAKKEAIRFIEKRMYDAIGLVIFARYAVTRCPLTLDKKMLTSLLHDLKIGFIDGDGTVISSSLLTAAARLTHSSAASKVIIFLTDGMPTVHDVAPEQALTLLKKLGIKVYTIGVGSKEGGYINHPFLGLVRTPTTLNVPLLERIAHETGGAFFLAENPHDIASIYDHIDRLEKSSHETTMFYTYYDIFMPFLIAILGCMALELTFYSMMRFIL